MILESELEALLEKLALSPPEHSWKPSPSDATPQLANIGMFRSGEKVAVNVHPTNDGPPIPGGADNIKPHSHEFIELSYLWSGSCMIEVEGNDEAMQPGDFIILDTNSSHLPRVEKPAILVNIAIDTRFFNDNFFHNFDKGDLLAGFFANIVYSQKAEKRYIVYRPENDPRIRQLITMILLEYYSDEPCNQRIIENLVIVLCCTMVRLQLRKTAKLMTRAESEDLMVSEILRYMSKHLQSINRNSLAEHFGYSYSYITSVLQSATGMTFTALKNTLRLQKAELLLRTSDQPVAEVARNSGYSNVTSFYEMFRRTYSMSPQKYREQNR